MSAVSGVARSLVVRTGDSKGWVIHALTDVAFDGAAWHTLRPPRRDVKGRQADLASRQ